MTQAVSKEIYDRIDNDIYEYGGDQWWKGDNIFQLLKVSVNPCRFPYFLNTYINKLKKDPHGKETIEVGCGGGILAEEIASAGFNLTGIDPAVILPLLMFMHIYQRQGFRNILSFIISKAMI